MSSRRRRPAALAWCLGALVLVLQVALGGSASAHAELTGSNPESGSRLERAPAALTLTFTESVDLVAGGLRLVDAEGDEVDTPEASVDGRTVRWPMPEGLSQGAYIASWRVVSSDSHPIAGVVTFGVRADAVDPPTTPVVVDDLAPWPVLAVRFLGYAGFAVFFGAFVFLLFCWTSNREAPVRATRLPMIGLLTGLVASVLGLLFQGPYLTGLPMREASDLTLLAETGETTFGLWMQARVFFYLALIAVLWGDRGLRTASTRWVGLVAAVGVAVSFSGTGHAASSGSVWDRVVDTVHVLAAGSWVGGLVLLAVLLVSRPGDAGQDSSGAAVARFSRVAMASVLVLVVTGTLNAVVHLPELADLWQSRYGRILLFKLGVVAVALAAAAFSRRSVHGDRSPWQSVRVEAAAVSAVLVVTTVLTMTPPPSVFTTGNETASVGQDTSATTVEMDLGSGRTAELRVAPLRPGGSRLRLEVKEADGSPLPVNRVELKLTLPAEDLGPFVVPLRKNSSGWLADFSFALPGTWSATLTVEDKALAGIVTTGDVTITE